MVPDKKQVCRVWKVLELTIQMSLAAIGFLCWVGFRRRFSLEWRFICVLGGVWTSRLSRPAGSDRYRVSCCRACVYPALHKILERALR